MSVSFNKLSGALGLLSLLVFVSGASAAPSLGFPAGRLYYGSGQSQAHVHHSYRPVVVTDANETRQSFSHDPAEHAAGTSDANAEKAAAPQATDNHAAADHATSSPQTNAPQTTTRQSFSYEPTTQSHRSMRHSRHRDAWQYQKTDARRGH